MCKSDKNHTKEQKTVYFNSFKNVCNLGHQPITFNSYSTKNCNVFTNLVSLLIQNITLDNRLIVKKEKRRIFFFDIIFLDK